MRRAMVAGFALYFLSGVVFAQAGQFLVAPQYPTGTNPQAVATGDFRRNGKVDVAAVNSTSNTVSVLLGNGDGTFQSKVDYATGSTPQGVAVGDFNGDGIPDLAVTNSASNTVSVLLGNGDGTFQAKVDYATGSTPQGVAVGDFNGDGHIDLVVTNSADNSVGVLLGNGNGTFKAHVDYKTGFNPYAVAVGDFNGDGMLDLAIANNNNNNVISVLLGKGDGTFQTQFQYGSGNTPFSIAVGDLNGDGKLDLVVADQQGNAVSVLLGTGNGSFSAHADYNTAAFPTSVTLGDFNGDGIPDIAVAAGNGNTVSVLLGHGDGTFGLKVNYGTGDIPYAVAAADFNGDKKLDLIVANSGGNSVSLLAGNGDGTFQTRVDNAAGAYPNSVAVGDFNGDGIQDLAVATSNCPDYPTCGAGTVSILLGSGGGKFQAPAHFSTGTSTDPYSLAVGDFNGDHILDLAVVNYATNTVSVMIGVGDGTFPSHVDYPVGSEPTSVAVADVNGDGKLDLVVTNFHGNTASVLLGNGDGTFKPAVSYATGNGPISVAVADFNGDHKPDLVIVNETDNNVSILLGNGDGTFQTQVAYPTGVGGNPLSVTVGDFNGDHNLDLAVADYRTQRVSVLLGNGDGTFQAVKAYPTGASPSSLVMADFNGDGKLDLALTSTPLGSSPGNLVSLLLGNGDGTFGTPALFGTGSQSYSAAVGDFNGDGTADLAVANGISSTVSVLLNSQGTQISVTPSSNPSVYGESVNFTAAVDASVTGPQAPTGTMTLKRGSQVLGSGALVDGQFSVSTARLPTGTDSVSASYSGDSNFQPHTVTVKQTVDVAGSTAQLASSANPSAEGGSVTFTAMVSSATTGTPTGTLIFLDGTIEIGTAMLNSNGVGTLSISTLSIGTHSITAAYSGDTNFAATTSPALNQVVQAGNTSTTLTSSLNPSADGQAVTFTAKIASGSPGTPTGIVNFMEGTRQTGSSTLSASGTATLSVSAMTVGTHSITAIYNGDANFSTSTSSALSQVVQPGNTSVALTSSPNPSAFDQSLTLTATVSSIDPGIPTGTVTFSNGTTALGSSAVSASGVATLFVTSLPVGMNNVTAAYSGDSNFTGAASPAMGQSVQKAGTATTVNSSSTSANLMLIAAVKSATSGMPTGTVIFLDGTTQLGGSPVNASGVGTLSSHTLGAGTHHITAIYGGDGNYNSSTSSVVSITAGFALSAGALSPSSIAAGQSATSDITITPSNGFNASGVSLTCAVTPAANPAPTCSVGSISVANGIGTATVTTTTEGATAALAPNLTPNIGNHRSGNLLTFALMMPGVVLFAGHIRKRRKLLGQYAVLFVLGGCLLQAACGGGTSYNGNKGVSGTPAGTYTITITGSANGTQHTASVVLKVQ